MKVKCSKKKKQNITSYSFDNRGASLIVAIVVMAVVIIFTLSLLLVTYTLYASQNKKIASLKCSEAANSLSVALEKELTDPNAYEKSWLWNYLRFSLLRDDTWPYYVEGATSGHSSTEAYRYFNFKYNKNYYPVEGFPGEISICMYWTLPTTLSQDTKDALLAGTKKIYQLSASEKNSARLNVEITCSTGSQTYTVMNRYIVNVSGYSDSQADAQMAAVVPVNSLNDDYNPFGPIEGVADYNNYIGSEKWEFKLDSRE